MQNLNIYLKPTTFMDSNHPEIVKITEKLTKDVKNDQERTKNLFYYVRDNCHYNMYVTSTNIEDYKASTILKQGEGFCVQKAVLLAALGRAAGVPSRLFIAAIRNHKAPPEVVETVKTNIFFPHAYNQFYINGKWISCAATFDKIICENINVPTVEFDGINDALLPDKDNFGNPYIEYVKKYGDFDDVPLEWMFKTIPEYYGTTYTKWF